MFTTTAQLERMAEENRKNKSGFYNREPAGGRYYTDAEQKEWEDWCSENGL